MDSNNIKLNWIDAEGQKPEGKCLILYYTQFFGHLTPEFGMGYFDNPDDYEDGNGRGWILDATDRDVLVSHFIPLPKEPFKLKNSSQKYFYGKFGMRPEFGIIPNNETIEKEDDSCIN